MKMTTTKMMNRMKSDEISDEEDGGETDEESGQDDENQVLVNEPSKQPGKDDIQLSERLLRGLDLTDQKRPSLGTPSPKKVDKKKRKVGDSHLRKSLNFEVVCNESKMKTLTFVLF